MGLDQVAEELYALPPEEFTAARDAAAKAEPALNKQLAALRRPTVSAWVVNVLARQDPATLDELLALGPALADAQASGEGTALRALSQQRRSLLGAVAARAVELAGREVTAAVRAEVEATLDAGLVDPASADAVRSGRLVRGLSFAGFGGVDLEGATAGPVVLTRKPAGKGSAGKAAGDGGSRATRPTAAEVRARAELERLEAAALEAAGRLDDAVRALDAAAATETRAAADLTAADQEVARAEEALALARQRRTEVQGVERDAAAARAEAERAVARAQTRAEKARQALDSRRRG